MFASGSTAQRQRPALVGAIMLGVLLVSVAAAWWLSASHAAPARRGARILRTVRRDGLARYWSPEPWRATYEGVNESGRKVAAIEIVRRGSEGGYDGQKGVADTQGRFSERWELSTDARSGTYTGPAGPAGQITTRITLRDGKVTVEYVAPGVVARATTDAPDNYLPEGMAWLALRLAAEGGSKAAFRTLINDEAIQSGRVHFATLVMDPTSPRTVEVRTIASRFTQETIYHLDERGRVLRFERETPNGRTVFRRVQP